MEGYKPTQKVQLIQLRAYNPQLASSKHLRTLQTRAPLSTNK